MAGNAEPVMTEKSPPANLSYGLEETGQTSHAPAPPSSWMYRTFNIGPLHFPGYATPPVQLAVVAFVCFMCPGMFNAVNGLGGGGQFAAKVADNANVAVYSAFSVVGFFAGSVANRKHLVCLLLLIDSILTGLRSEGLGIKLTLSFGGLGYFLYVSSYLSYNRNANAGFVYFAGAFLGVCAGLLWTAQGAIMMSYPDESSKGRYISWFWMVFNLGGVLGSL